MKTLLTQHENSVLTVTLNRPDVHNAFNEGMMHELHDVFGKAATDASIRAIVIAASGKSFCAGGDLNYMKSAAGKTREQNIDESLFMAQMFRQINECPKPVIGLVHGAVMGGGVGLMSVCDIVLADPSTMVSLSEVKLGLNPSVISPFVMAKIGAGAARRYFVTGERFGAEEARRIGLVHEIVDESSREAVLKKILQQILSNGPQAVSEVKQLIRANIDLAGDTLTRFTAEKIAELRASAEAQEGMRAFFEKRPPAYAKSL